MRLRVLGAMGCLVMSAAMMPAQTAAPAATPPVAAAAASAAPEGSISGHVYLADTNGPARFARVMLKLVPDAASAAAMQKKAADMMKIFQNAGGKSESDADTKARQAAMMKMKGSIGDMNLSGVVGADGTYKLTGVKPGSYYIHAIVSGYIDPMRDIPSEDLQSLDPSVQKSVRDVVATVTVNGSEAVHQDLRLERGAAITGHVSFDDGSPAVGWTVSVITVKKATDGTVAPDTADADLPNMAELMSKIIHITDDRGFYRIAGLPAGDYVVRAVLDTQNASAGGGMISGGALKLTVLSGNVTKRQDATTVSLTAGQELGDEDLIMPLSKLHSISGRVQAKLDAHAINAGTLSLTEDDAGPGAIFRAQSATVQDDGTFRFDYIANGHYTLKIANASIEQGNGKTSSFFGIDTPDSDTIRGFADGEQKVDISDADVNGVVFTLADVPVIAKKAKDDDK